MWLPRSPTCVKSLIGNLPLKRFLFSSLASVAFAAAVVAADVAAVADVDAVAAC